MDIKSIIKYIFGFIRAKKNGVVLRGCVYIGKHCNIQGRKNIVFGERVQIRPYCDIYGGDEGLVIGNNCDIGTRNRIAGHVCIEESVLTGPDVFICSYDHEYRDISKSVIEQKEFIPKRNKHDGIIIGSGSWIGIHAVISGDVHIGKHCVIGANSVVIMDVPDFCVVAGAPAKILKRYNFTTQKWEKV